MSQLCSEEEMVELIRVVQADSTNDIDAIDRLLTGYPHDPRLHFLKGSVLASAGKLLEAHTAMKIAVDIAPDFLIARFQLGFFELSSGEAQAALANWRPLEDLDDSHYLRRFVAGLTHLIRDEFELAVSNLREGIALNNENPPLNGDMQLIIDKCIAIIQEKSSNEEDEIFSSTSMLLNQSNYSDKAN